MSVMTEGDDEAQLSHGVYDAYTQRTLARQASMRGFIPIARRNLRYSQMAPVNMFAEKNTKPHSQAVRAITVENDSRLWPFCDQILEVQLACPD